MAIEKYTSRQSSGSEYGGVDRTKATIQPQPPEALGAADHLRLGYLTGEETDTESLEDRRQMWGLRPANGERPTWLLETGQRSQAEIDHPELLEGE